MRISFSKYHALGNDYLVVDPKRLSFLLSTEQIARICHRNYGVGADGLLWGPLESEPWKVRIFNADGSEAEKSGNGTRIFGKFLFDQGYVTQDCSLLTSGGLVEIHFSDKEIEANLGKAQIFEDPLEDVRSFLQARIPIHSVHYVSVGNPHLVIVVNKTSEELAKTLGPLLENHPHFPQRTNVQWMQVLDRKNLKIEIWERGSGYTLASGTSSCACAWVAHFLKQTDPSVTVHMQGGQANLQIQKDQIFMSSQVTFIAEGTWEISS
jgi:diaminopimelate epimerase